MAAAITVPPPFPAFDSISVDNQALFNEYRGELERAYTAARELWETSRKAEAMAELRRNERDHPAGALLVSLRQEAENRLGLPRTADENSRKSPPPLLFALAGLALAAILLCVWFIRASSGKKRRLLCAVTLLAAAGLIGVVLTVSPTVTKAPRSGVMRETVVRRIPDTAGEAVTSFREGQPVLLSRTGKSGGDAAGMHGSWVPVIANDDSGASGWVPEATVIWY